MSRVSRWLLAFGLSCSGLFFSGLFFSAFAPHLQADDSLAPLVDKCLLRLAWQSTPEEVATLSEACPLLLHELQSRGLDNTLEGTALEDLTANQLSLYVDTTTLWGTPENRAVAPLGPILAELDVEDFAKRSLYDQFKDWLAGFFPEGTRESIEELLKRILPDFEMSDTTWSLIGDLLMAAIIAGAIAIVVIELFRSGLFTSKYVTRKGVTRRKAGPRQVSTSAAGESTPAEVTPAALFERLTRLIAERFGRPNAPSLSHREAGAVVAGLGVLPETTREDLSLFVSGAERIRYGAWTPESAERQAVVRAGESVLQVLKTKEPV